MNPRIVKLLLVAAPVATFCAFLAIWQLVVVAFHVSPIDLPTPTAIGSATAASMSSLLYYTWNSAQQSLEGVAIAVVLALVISVVATNISFLKDAITIVAGAMRSLPTISLYPIVSIFVGIAWQSIVAMVVLGTCPIMITFCVAGLEKQSDLVDVFHTFNASRLQTLLRIRLPLAVPYFVSGFKMVLPFSVIISVISQYFGGAADALGSEIRTASSQLEATTMWTAIVLACALGLAAYGIGAGCEYAINTRFLRQR